jgi:formate hydrogenlyase subunit 3/multisubunit Na+/H+ antiporter MnhD subunit
MSLGMFLVVCGTGAVLGLADRQSGRIGRWAGPIGLLAALAAALFIGSTTRVTIGDVDLVGSQYSGRFLACAAGSALLACLVATASGWPDRLAPAALVSFAGLAVATTAVDSGVALAAGAASATAGAIVIVRSTPRGQPVDGRLAEIRTIAVVAAALLFAAVAVLRPAWNAASDAPVFVLAFFGLGIALAIRSGAVPFHVPAARLGHVAAPLAPALLLVWIPAGVGLLAISWSATTFCIRNDWLNAAVAVVQTVAVATLVLGALAALVHDELEEIAAYSIVADSGFVLLALASRSDAAAEPARLWLLVFVAAKTGLVAWAAATARAFGTSHLGRLRGWLRRTPLLGLALVAIAVATLGWPGSAVYEARSTLIRLALPAQLQFLFVVAMVLSVACYGRLLAVGLLPSTEDVRTARSERPRWVAGPSRPPRSPAATPETAPTSATISVAGGAEAELAAAPAAGEAAEMQAVPAASKRRRSRTAALALPTPAVTAAARGADESAGVGSLAAPPDSAPDQVPTDAAPVRPSFRHQLVLAWRFNRTLEVSLVVVVGAALAVALAFGGLGAADASRFGMPLDTAARATPTPTPPPTPAFTPTPLPTLAPPATALPSSSGGPSGSVAPSASPSPVKTLAPARGNGQ